MIKAEGIVLSELRFKDTSKILNIYTKSMGKIPVMARGAYKANSKLMASTQVFSFNDYVFNKGRTFYYLNQGNIIKSFYNIRENIDRFIYGSYILEIVEKSSPEEEGNIKLFSLLEKSLDVLSKLDGDFMKFIVAFQLKFVSFIGYRPYLEKCVICNNSLSKGLRWSHVEGGIVCKNCHNFDRSSIPVDNKIYRAIVELMYVPYDKMSEVDVPLETLKFLQNMLEDYILYNIDRKKFNSFKMIETLSEYN